MNQEQRLAHFLFEIGTMRKLPRMHRQTLLTDDMSDNIASHSYRVALIGWFLAQSESLDPYKTIMMCLLHDLSEARTGDHNWIHKRYTKIYEDQIIEEQLGTLPFPELKDLAEEYAERESPEAIAAKDADLIDQVLLLREYEWQGNREAALWLRGKPGETSDGNAQINNLKLETSKKIAQQILEENPSDWWNNLWTNKNR